ncbi:MAG: transglycosylase domain-containing protein, partial [Cyclobacteriaceae bacterium]|nr:transglycosylase domain-containing protein [Cyclobacteriaceae bacterium]
MRKKWVFWSLMSLVGWFLLFLLWPWNKPLFDSPYATLLVDRENVLLGATIADDGQWRFPPSDSIPKKYIQAVLQYEDRDFYNHPGISIKAIIRATIQNIQEGRVVSGGSTLTMQTVRMMRGNQSRTFFEKFIELFYAFKLDHTHSKEEILKMYAFHAPFGGNVVGIEAASWRYFGRKSYELTWAEIATLAVLPNSPSLIYPGKNSTRLREKRNRLLKRLWDVNLIDEETYNLALLEELPGKPFPLPGLTPHLLTRAINEGRKGEYIESTLSRKLQVWTEGRIESHMEALRANGVYNAAALILDVKTGETLAYVGNVNSGEEHGQDVDIITAQRSPGSLLKPFLYAFSIDKGIISPYQMLPDVPTFYRDFTPENFDHKFYGAVNANYALARSLNVPFVNLLKEYGYEQFHHDMQQAGMESLTHPASHYGLSLILGGAETSLWEI